MKVISSHRLLTWSFLTLGAVAVACSVDVREGGVPAPQRRSSNETLPTGLGAGEQLGINYFTLNFDGGSGDALAGTGMHTFGALATSPGASLRFFDGATSQANGVYDIAYKNGTSVDTITAIFQNVVPVTGNPLFGGGFFDGTALWLGHSRFKHGAAPPIGSTSPPATGTLWNGTTGPADPGTDVIADDDHLISIPVVQNQVTQQSFLVSAQVYTPTHASARYSIRTQPNFAREGNGSHFGLTTPGGGGPYQLDLSSVLDQWAMLQVRADVTTNGGSLPDPSDDTGQVTFRYFLNGTQVGNAVTIQFDPTAMQAASHTGPVLFSPAYGVTHGWQGDAPEIFLDDISVDAIVGNTSLFAMTSPAAGATIAGTTDLRVSLGNLVGVSTVEYSLGSHSLGIVSAPPFAMPWVSGYVDDGQVRVVATARDAVGLTLGTDQRDFVAKNHGNSLTIDAVSSDADPSMHSLDGTLSGKVSISLTATDAKYYPSIWLLYVDGEAQTVGGTIFTDQSTTHTVSVPAAVEFPNPNTPLVLDTTRLTNGTHELYIAVHSRDRDANGNAIWPADSIHRANISPRAITVDNSNTKPPPALTEVVIDPQHLYLAPGATSPKLTCTQRYSDGSASDCSGALSSDNTAVKVNSDGSVTAGNVEGFANISVAGAPANEQWSAYVWVHPDRHVAHFGKDGKRLTNYVPNESLYAIAPFVLDPATVQKYESTLLPEVQKAGVNTLFGALLENPRSRTMPFDTWKAAYDNLFSARLAYARKNNFSLLLVNDDAMRRPAGDAWWMLNWPNSQQAFTYAASQVADITLGVDMVDETSALWGATPYPKAKLGDPGFIQSITCSTPHACTVKSPDLPASQLRPGTSLANLFVLLNPSNASDGLATPPGTVFQATNLQTGFNASGTSVVTQFDFDPGSPLVALNQTTTNPNAVSAGTYDATSDPNLEWSLYWPSGYDPAHPTTTAAQCGLNEPGSNNGALSCSPQVPNEAVASFVDWMRNAKPPLPDGGAGSPLNISWPVLGIADTPPSDAVVAAWDGRNGPNDYASHYFDTREYRHTYPWAWSVRESTYWMRTYFYSRQKDMDLTHPQIMLASLCGPSYTVGATQTPHANNYDPLVDTLNVPGASPETVVAQVLTGAAIGNAGSKLFQFGDATPGARVNLAAGTFLGVMGADPLYTNVPLWRAMSYAANAITKAFAPYLLADVLDSPGIGRDVVTAARQGSDARLVMAVNARDWPRTINMDLTRYAYGLDVVRYQVGPHGIDVTKLPDGTTNDTVTLGVGEAAVFLLYASQGGSANAITNTTFSPALPSGATSAVLRTGYIYGDELANRTGGGVSCTGSCTIPLDRRLGDVFYQYVYLDGNGAIVGTSPITPLH